MGLLDSITGAIVLRYKAETDQAKAKVRELSGEQKKAAKEAADALEQQGKAAEGLSAKWAKGAAVIAGTYVVARDGLRAYREDVRLTAGAAGVDIDRLSTAYDGLKTRTDLLTLAQAGHRGAWKLTTGQIEQVIGGMRALEKKGFDAQQVFDKFTDVLRKGKTEGLDDFGISIQSTGDQAKDLQILMAELGRQVLDVGGNFEKAGDAAERSIVRMEDGLSRLRTTVGRVTAGVLDMAASFGAGWGEAIFGSLPEDNGPGGKASAYADKFRAVRGPQINRQHRGFTGMGTGSLGYNMFAGTSSNDDAAGQALASFSDAVRKGMRGKGPLATASPEEFAQMIAGLPSDWKAVDPFLAERVDQLSVNLEKRFQVVGANAVRGILAGFRDAFERNKRSSGRGRGRGGGSDGDLGPGLFFGAVDRITSGVDNLAAFEDARSAGAAASQARLDALGNAGMMSDLGAGKAGLAQLQQAFADVIAADEQARAEKDSWLASVFGPLEDFDAYGEALRGVSDVAQASWGTVVAAIANGEELSAGKIRKAIGSVLAAKATELGADGLMAVLRGTYHTATGDPRGPGEIVAGGAMMAGALTIATLARGIGGSAAATPTAARGGGGGAGGARTNSGSGPGSGQNYVVLGSTFEDQSPRQRQRQIYRAINNVATVYRPPEGSS